MRASRFLDWLRNFRISYCNFPEVVAKQPVSSDDRMDHLVALSCYSHRRENYAMYERRFGGRARQGFFDERSWGARSTCRWRRTR